MAVPPTLCPGKVALRGEYRARRREHVAALGPGGRRAAGRALAALLRPRLPAGPVGAYHPIAGELDPAPAAPGAALPWFAAHGADMLFRAGPAAAPGPFGIAQPAPDAPLVEPAVVLVPVVAVDRRGFRLGQGGGCYDRWLAALPRRDAVWAVGLAWECQLADALPAEPWDMPLDAVCTPSQYLLLPR